MVLLIRRWPEISSLPIPLVIGAKLFCLILFSYKDFDVLEAST